MPEAAVDEDRDSPAGIGNVGSAWHLLPVKAIAGIAS